MIGKFQRCCGFGDFLWCFGDCGWLVGGGFGLICCLCWCFLGGDDSVVGSWCEWCFWVLCWDCGFPGYFGLMWGWYNIEFRGVGLGVGVRVGCWWWFTGGFCWVW